MTKPIFIPTQPGQDRAGLYGKSVTRNHGGIGYADKFGTDLTMRSSAPPPIAEYDAYLKASNVRFRATNHSTQKTGYRLRRIVVMRRAGASWKECGEAVGISSQIAKEWVEFLPLELAV